MNVVMATASPYKFSRDVLEAVGGERPQNGFAAMDRLSQITDTSVPPNLAMLRDMTARFDDVADKNAMLAYVKEALEH